MISQYVYLFIAKMKMKSWLISKSDGQHDGNVQDNSVECDLEVVLTDFSLVNN